MIEEHERKFIGDSNYNSSHPDWKRLKSEHEREKPSELQVLESNAGFYIGRLICGIPYSRESNYFADKESADDALKNNSYERRCEP